MSPFDIVKVPGYPGLWSRRCVVDQWVAAGRPPLDGAGRTKEKQRWFYQQWLNGTGNAADNPDADTRQPHVRGMALDLAWRNPPADVVERMAEAGFIRPITVRKGKPWKDGKGGFSQDEPWHFELDRFYRSVTSIGKVTAAMAAKALPYVAPAPAGGGGNTFNPATASPIPDEREKDDMSRNVGVATQRQTDGVWFYLIHNLDSGRAVEFNSGSNKPAGGEVINSLAVAYDTPPWAKVSESLYGAIKRGLNKVESVSVDLNDDDVAALLQG